MTWQPWAQNNTPQTPGFYLLRYRKRGEPDSRIRYAILENDRIKVVGSLFLWDFTDAYEILEWKPIEDG
jgi:hypothetical protein